jgi:hypothetical protein
VRGYKEECGGWCSTKVVAGGIWGGENVLVRVRGCVKERVAGDGEGKLGRGAMLDDEGLETGQCRLSHPICPCLYRL